MRQADYPELAPVADMGPEAYIAALYKGLGWDGTSELDPTKIIISQQRWLEVCDEFNKLPGPGIGGYVWMNYGPTSDADVPYNSVRIEPGAFKELSTEQSLGTSGQAERIEMGSNPGQRARGADKDRPLDDLMREAKEKAQERSIGRQHSPRAYKPPELGL